MSFTDDLSAEVTKILKDQWQTRETSSVPETPDLRLGNDSAKLTGTVLYADLADSTGLVLEHRPHFAAEVYKCYLACACRVIRQKGGVITAFDGDRVMAIFIGDNKNTSAVRAALAINHAVVKIINPRVKDQYPKLADTFSVKHSVGIDTSELFVARTGIRGANDLVWVGRAANIAAKLCGLRDGNYATWITDDVFKVMHESVKTSEDGRPMWEARTWTTRNMSVHRSSWYWGA
ncbi:MAG: adenylate/guanylate cyclase domain-containing protein [Labilithrix sp.]|nr:adenylate/guanylate cyclase domain-containing protein [Labilithrix sp.]